MNQKKVDTLFIVMSRYITRYRRVQQLTGITNKTVKSLGLPFGEIMAGRTGLLHREQAQSETIPVIIAHGEYSHDAYFRN